MKISKTLAFLLSIAFGAVSNAEEKKLTLLGFDKMIKEIDGVVVTDKTYFTRRLKNGAPKYLHQIKDEFYYMQVIPSGYYTLELSPAEWFEIERVETDKFKVRIIEPMDMYYKFKSDEFSINWKVDEVVYCDECNDVKIINKFKSNPGLPSLEAPFKLLGFNQMLKEFYGAIDSDDIELMAKKDNGRPKYLHQIKNEVYTLMVSEPGHYSLKLKPENWFKIKQIKGDVFQVQFLDPVYHRALEAPEGFTVDWQLDEIEN